MLFLHKTNKTGHSQGQLSIVGKLAKKCKFLFAKSLKLAKWTYLPNMVSLAHWEPVSHDCSSSYYYYTLKIMANLTSLSTQFCRGVGLSAQLGSYCSSSLKVEDGQVKEVKTNVFIWALNHVPGESEQKFKWWWSV